MRPQRTSGSSERVRNAVRYRARSARPGRASAPGSRRLGPAATIPAARRAERVEDRCGPIEVTDDLASEVAAQLRVRRGEARAACRRAVDDHAVDAVTRNLSDDRRVVGEVSAGTRPASRSSRRASRTRRRTPATLRPAERVRSSPTTVTAVRQPSVVVGVGAETGHPLRAVRGEREEVRRRVRVGRRARRRRRRSCAGAAGRTPGAPARPSSLVGRDQDVDADLLDESPRLGERRAVELPSSSRSRR